MYLEWPEDERCPYCQRKGAEPSRIVAGYQSDLLEREREAKSLRQRVNELEEQMRERGTPIYSATAARHLRGKIEAQGRLIAELTSQLGQLAELEDRLANVEEWLNNEDCEGCGQQHWYLTLVELLWGKRP